MSAQAQAHAMIASSVIATDAKGRRGGAQPLCSLEEIDYLLEIIDSAYGRGFEDLSEGEEAAPLDRLRVLFDRARASPHFTLRGVRRMRRHLQGLGAARAGTASFE